MSIRPNQEIYFAARSWGGEYIIYLTNNFMVKILYILKGKKGGLQYHRLKNEFGFVLRGKLLVRKGITTDFLNETILCTGSLFAFPPKTIHQEEALEDTLILELSSPHVNDRVRLDNDSNNPLPSTLESDVVDLGKINSPDLTLATFGFKSISVSEVPPEICNYLSFHYALE